MRAGMPALRPVRGLNVTSFIPSWVRFTFLFQYSIMVRIEYYINGDFHEWYCRKDTYFSRLYRNSRFFRRHACDRILFFRTDAEFTGLFQRGTAGAVVVVGNVVLYEFLQRIHLCGVFGTGI